MALFIYSNIEFSLDPDDPEGISLPLGLFAEWNDGHFWKVAMCARNELTFEEFEELDQFGKTLIEKPFKLLYEITKNYFNRIGPKQNDHLLEKYLIKCFPANVALQAPSLYQYTIDPEEDPDELFEDLAESIPIPSTKSIWFRIPEEVK